MNKLGYKLSIFIHQANGLFKQYCPTYHRQIRSKSGMALIMAILSVVLITHIVNEISYETNIEYIVNAKSIQRVKAFYAARAGVELSLLRIKIYNQLSGQLSQLTGGQGLGAQGKMLDLIWSFPFLWPPIIPEGLNGVDTDTIKSKVKESKLDTVYQTTITDEGSKIDINDLDSPVKSIRESTKKLIMQIFDSKMQQDEAWAKKNQGFKSEELVNNIIDWIDADRDGLNGTNEGQMYADLPGISDLGITYPPNRFFRTVEEVRLVAGMTDELFQILLPRITVYGAKAINPNSAPPDLIQSLDPTITSQIMAEFTKRRNDPQQPPYSKADEFWGFLEGKGAQINAETKKTTPLTFTKPINFRIKSIGEFSGATRQIEAVVYDSAAALNSVAESYKKQQKENSGGGDSSGDGSGGGDTSGQKSGGQNNQQTPTKGPPKIIYWKED